ncbi:unnamed protein product [Blumeria hordei]|uniref:Uncharacterized protein n=2 Tax=Blumeria hordei TaxID=2867405 RepID=A0A383V3F4_BLUHO|nr:CSEP0454 putative effector protein [Blumeria hordei DH14]SZF06325.1 unnamed protein product [Blumeria hordei]
MIRCAFAFLLIVGKSSDRLDRLVVTTDEVEKPSYGVYEVKDRDYFTNSEFIDTSIFSETKTTKQGTYYMPYCSDHLDSNEIARKITKGLTDITHQAHLGFVPDTEKENNCLNSLFSISNLELDQNMIDLSKCEKKVRRTCTSRTILNLAFTGIIAVDGPYKAFAPQKADQPIVVADDQPMDMSLLVLDGEMFGRIRTKYEEIALAWYQGHLQLFKQDLKTDNWTPVTLIGSEIWTGSLITNHILKLYPNTKLGWTEFYKKKEAIIQAYKSPMNRRRSRSDKYYNKIYDFINSFDRRKDRLLYNYPFLDLEYSLYLSDSHEQPVYFFGTKLKALSLIFTMGEKLYHKRLSIFMATGKTGSPDKRGIT